MRADFLRGLVGPGGLPLEVSFVGHSLRCRLILETLRNVINKTLPWPIVRFVALMAAAVPIDLVEAGQLLEPAARRPHTLTLFRSLDDDVLKRAFPTGQHAAFKLGLEQ